MTTIVERVQAGVAYLDEHHPDWAYRLDLKALNLANCKACVLGQIFGHYEDAPLESRACAPALGFEVGWYVMDDAIDEFSSPSAEYAELTAEWTRVVLARRDAAILALETPVPDDGGEGQ